MYQFKDFIIAFVPSYILMVLLLLIAELPLQQALILSCEPVIRVILVVICLCIGGLVGIDLDNRGHSIFKNKRR